MAISMTLSKEDFSLRDGALDPMDICMTLLKGVEIARFFDNFLNIVTAIANIHCKRFDASRWGGGSDGHLYDFAKRCKVLIQQNIFNINFDQIWMRSQIVKLSETRWQSDHLMPVGEWSMCGIKSKHPKPFWWGQPHHNNHSTKSPSHQVIKSPSKHPKLFCRSHYCHSTKSPSFFQVGLVFWWTSLWLCEKVNFHPISSNWVIFVLLSLLKALNSGQVWLIALELWIRRTPLWLCQKIRRRKKCAQNSFKSFWAFCQYGTLLEIEANKSLKVFCL